jgi:hypothetical protein
MAGIGYDQLTLSMTYKQAGAPVTALGDERARLQFTTHAADWHSIEVLNRILSLAGQSHHKSKPKVIRSAATPSPF